MAGKIVEKLVNIVVNLPLHPYWLEWKKSREANERILKHLKGKIIEVGSGDGSRKAELLSRYSRIKEYISTDFSGWDKGFEKINRRIKKLGVFSAIWAFKKKVKLDNVCRAEKLPYKNNTFDFHLSFEVLEHIEEPNEYFREATRVIKKEGEIIVVVPFLYRVHGGDPEYKSDFFRYSNGFFYSTARKNKLKLVKIYSNTGFGTTFASLTNQWFIQNIAGSSIPVKIFLILFSPILFTSTNLIGYLIDISPDKRFATRQYIVFKK